MDVNHAMTNLQDIRRGLIETRKALDTDAKMVEAALDALNAPYIAISGGKPDKIANQRKVLEILQHGPKTIKDVQYILEREEWGGVKTETGVRNVVYRLVEEGKLNEVKDSFPKRYRMRRDLTIVPGEGEVKGA